MTAFFLSLQRTLLDENTREFILKEEKMQELAEIFGNKVVQCAFYSWAIAQIIKIIIDAYKTKSLSIDLIVSSGGFPSSL